MDKTMAREPTRREENLMDRLGLRRPLRTIHGSYKDVKGRLGVSPSGKDSVLIQLRSGDRDVLHIKVSLSELKSALTYIEEG